MRAGGEGGGGRGSRFHIGWAETRADAAQKLLNLIRLCCTTAQKRSRKRKRVECTGGMRESTGRRTGLPKSLGLVRDGAEDRFHLGLVVAPRETRRYEFRTGIGTTGYLWLMTHPRSPPIRETDAVRFGAAAAPRLRASVRWTPHHVLNIIVKVRPCARGLRQFRRFTLLSRARRYIRVRHYARRCHDN